MKRTFTFCILTLLAFGIYGQQISVHSISVSDKNGFKSFSVGMSVSTEVDGFTGKISEEKSTFSKLEDNTGRDLLEAQRQYEREQETKGQYYQPFRMECYGVAYEYEGFDVNFQLQVLPANGAESVTAAGNIAMIMEGDKESKAKLKKIPMNGDNIDSKIGSVYIQEGGSISTDEEEFIVYRLVSEMPITSLTVKGDDTQLVREKFNTGVEANEFVFQSAPETVDISLTYKSIEIRNIPFDKKITIGL